MLSLVFTCGSLKMWDYATVTDVRGLLHTHGAQHQECRSNSATSTSNGMLDGNTQAGLHMHAQATGAYACIGYFNRTAAQSVRHGLCLQKLEAEHAEQLQIVMTVVSRMERVEAELRAMKEQQTQRQQSKWGIFSLQGR